MTPAGVTVFCDATLAPALRRLASRLLGAPAAILSAPASSMLAQLTRHTHNDVLFTLSTAMDQAVGMQLVKPATRLDGFSNTMVLAARAGQMAPVADPMDLPAKLTGKTIAVTDMTAASGLDGRALLAANGLGGAGWTIGAANTGDVAFLLTSGAADVGLLYLTDARADRGLMVIAALAASPALTHYSAAVNAKAMSPNAQAVLNLLGSAQASGALRDAGLMVAA